MRILILCISSFLQYFITYKLFESEHLCSVPVSSLLWSLRKKRPLTKWKQFFPLWIQSGIFFVFTGPMKNGIIYSTWLCKWDHMTREITCPLYLYFFSSFWYPIVYTNLNNRQTSILPEEEISYCCDCIILHFPFGLKYIYIYFFLTESVTTIHQKLDRYVTKWLTGQINIISEVYIA